VKARAKESLSGLQYAPSHACHPERTPRDLAELVDHTRLFGAQLPARGVPRRLRVSGWPRALFNVIY